MRRKPPCAPRDGAHGASLAVVFHRHTSLFIAALMLAVSAPLQAEISRHGFLTLHPGTDAAVFRSNVDEARQRSGPLRLAVRFGAVQKGIPELDAGEFFKLLAYARACGVRVVLRPGYADLTVRCGSSAPRELASIRGRFSSSPSSISTVRFPR
ncbi:MAG: hypothetical protein FGM15_08940 [Chthoniobacterales bacterium]|nr:hypothetical protein [Chthoniobacterales bacterium]